MIIAIDFDGCIVEWLNANEILYDGINDLSGQRGAGLSFKLAADIYIEDRDLYWLANGGFNWDKAIEFYDKYMEGLTKQIINCINYPRIAASN